MGSITLDDRTVGIAPAGTPNMDTVATYSWTANGPTQLNFNIRAGEGLNFPTTNIGVQYYDPFEGRTITQTIPVTSSDPNFTFSIVTGVPAGSELSVGEVRIVAGSVSTVPSFPGARLAGELFGAFGKGITNTSSLRKASGFEVTLLSQTNPESQCFLAGTPISMWPVNAGIEIRPDGLYDEASISAAIWEKSIEQVTVDDWVVSYDANGNLKPGRVKRAFRNEAKIILDFHGTFVTPGHVYYCAGGKYEGQHVPLIDILRDDGLIQNENGGLIRASTGCEVGTDNDKTFWAFLLDESADGAERVCEKKLLRFGTRFMLSNGQDFSMRDYLNGINVEIIESGPYKGCAYLKKTGIISVFAWTLSEHLPNPEDYVLARSQTTLENIYRAGEWRTVHPRMPAPMIMDGGFVQPMTAQGCIDTTKNMPVAYLDDTHSSKRNLNRQGRKAEAQAVKQRETKQALGALH